MNEDTLFEEMVKEVFGTSEIPDIKTIKPSDKLSEHMLSRLTEEEKKKCYFDYSLWNNRPNDKESYGIFSFISEKF